jgi:hypothetical protein
VTAMPSAGFENVVSLAPKGGSDLVRVDPGRYSAVYVKHRGLTIYRTPKVKVEFRLLAHPEVVLPRWYRVLDFRNGRISAPSHSDIVREISEVLGRRVRTDRLEVASLKDLVIAVEVEDVRVDRAQRSLAPINQYSRIARLCGKEP